MNQMTEGSLDISGVSSIQSVNRQLPSRHQKPDLLKASNDAFETSISKLPEIQEATSPKKI